jgi:Raf kinase inhibitor-like YbhB/YbcL family protein
VIVGEFELSSSAFAHGDPIPRRHTCDGDDVSPPLAWSPPPAGTRSLVLVVDDPDAPRGTFTHWLACGLDPDRGRLDEGDRPPTEGRNDFGETRYRGPCPPPGHGRHRYFFRLHAIDADVDLAPGFARSELERTVGEHVLAVAELVGTYER